MLAARIAGAWQAHSHPCREARKTPQPQCHWQGVPWHTATQGASLGRAGALRTTRAALQAGIDAAPQPGAARRPTRWPS